MSDAIDQGQVEVASEQGVKLKAVEWWPITEDPPTIYNLEVHGVSGAMYETDFTPGHLTELDSDNQMKVQVYQKIAGIIGKLKKHDLPRMFVPPFMTVPQAQVG